jgi:formamidopyrimidine-DNA glycosylase
MPELPEVETVTVGLRNQILGETFTNVQLNRHNLRIDIPPSLPKLTQNQVITKITRQAKYILIHLVNDYILILHLGMSGRILINPLKEPNKHNHVIFSLTNNHKIIFNDPRRFGLITICHSSELSTSKLFANLGLEPFAPGFDVEYLSNKLKKRSMPIKTALMNNQLVVGVGNIYACESLFRSRISPLRPSNKLDHNELQKLIAAIQQTLYEAIAAGGSSLKDYVNTKGDVGYFQNKLQVYGRTGKACVNCDNEIVQIKQAGRSTFYCPKCQV